MKNMKMLESEFKAFENLAKSINELKKLHDTNSDNIDDVFEDDDMNSLESIGWDVEHNDIFRAIQRFNSGETIVTAIDSVNGSGFHVIEILHGLYDAVFGYVVENDQKVFYVSEAKDSYNDETQEDETHFFIDETPINVNDCVRTDSGWI